MTPLQPKRKTLIESHMSFLCEKIRHFTPHYKITSCLAFCVIAKSYLKKFGISSKIYICETMVMNEKTHELFINPNQKPDKATEEALHYVHCKIGGGGEEDLGGHTILIVENQYILDPSGDQFYRPQKDIYAKRYWQNLESNPNAEVAESNKALFIIRVHLDRTYYIYEAYDLKSSSKARKSRDLKPQRHSLIIKSMVEHYKSRHKK